jgi:phosphatidylserine/phosphatidylglycerophosphate/cardiolipin synthase-like enzyme
MGAWLPIIWIVALALPTFCRADRVSLLTTDQNRLVAHLETAASARKELNVAFAFIHDDAVTRVFLNQLIETAKQAKVRLLLDRWGSELSRELVAYLVHNGVEVRYFHDRPRDPRRWKRDVPRFFKRMHDKMVDADGAVLVTGTENMGAPYYKSLVPSYTEPGFSGRNIKIEGAVAGEANRYFLKMWNSGDVSLPAFSLDLRPEKWVEQEKLCAEAGKQLLWDRNHEAPQAFDIDARDIEFVHSTPDGKGTSSLRAKIVDMMNRAENSILVETPYLLPKEPIAQAMADRAKQIDVTAVTNSGRSNNYRRANPLYEGAARKLGAEGVEVRHWTGDDTIHGKTVQIDERETLVMTENLNQRSGVNDTEMGIYIRSAPFAKAVRQALKVDHFTPLQSKGLMGNCLLGVLERTLRPFRKQF